MYKKTEYKKADNNTRYQEQKRIILHIPIYIYASRMVNNRRSDILNYKVASLSKVLIRTYDRLINANILVYDNDVFV